jgi:hypothetical protein
VLVLHSAIIMHPPLSRGGKAEKIKLKGEGKRKRRKEESRLTFCISNADTEFVYNSRFLVALLAPAIETMIPCH